MDEIKIKFRMSETKSPYMIIGKDNPADMVLPVVMDIGYLEKLLNQICKQVDPDISLAILPSDMKTATLKIRVER